VTLTVSDTGCGMSPETRAHIFEPFFTTKPTGKGTGLGLATVYGIVKQSLGSIEVESAPGAGALFRIYLPRLEGHARVDAESAAAHPFERSTGTVLLVEDEADLRELTGEVLADHGYTVLSAGEGAEALELARRHRGRIDLLLTDVVMPGMSGPDLAERLRTSRADTRVVFMSGYTDEALGHHGVLRPGIVMVQKPFVGRELARVLRSVLASPSPLNGDARSPRPSSAG
jgi:CheY-like chemotaxis protein